MDSIPTLKNEQPDANAARWFYDVIYKNAMSLQAASGNPLFYLNRYWAGGRVTRDNRVKTHAVEWKTKPWQRHMAELDVFLEQHKGDTLAPIPNLFHSSSDASLATLAAVVAIVYDADTDPDRAVRRVRDAIGPVTVMVKSGSKWEDPASGELCSKTHGYVRLKKPAVTKEEIDKAKVAQGLMTEVAASDSSSTCVHPLGLPGSLNVKKEIAVCRTIMEFPDYEDPEVEFELDDLIAKLRAALGKRSAKSKGPVLTPDLTPGVQGRVYTPDPVGDFNGENAGVDVEKAVAALTRGDEMHPNAVKIAAHYAGRGMKRKDVWLIVKGTIDGSVRDQGRKNDFYESGELDRIVDSAVDKFSSDKFVSEKPLILADGTSYSTDFPLAAIPPLMREAAVAIAGETATPVDFSAPALIGAASACTMYMADVETFSSDTSPLALFIMAIAESGARKTSLFSKFDVVFDRATAMMEAAWRAKEDIYVADSEAYDAALKNRRKNGGRMPPKPVPPPAPGFRHADTTSEGLVRHMVDGVPMAVLVASEALSIYGVAFSKDNGAKSAGTFNKMWDGKVVDVLRSGGYGGKSAERGKAARSIKNPRLAIIAAIQPEFGRGVLVDINNKASGFSSRQLITYPDIGFGKRKRTNKDPARIAAIKAFNDVLIDRLRVSLRNADAAYMHDKLPVAGAAQDFDTVEDADNPFGVAGGEAAGEVDAGDAGTGTDAGSPYRLPVLALSPGAGRARDAFSDEIEPKNADGGEFEFHRDFASKAVENAIRIAGVLTLIENAGATEVPELTMEKAITIMRWFIANRLKFEDGTDGTDVELAEKLVNWLKAKIDGGKLDGGIVSSRYIIQEGPRPLRDAKRLNSVAAALVEKGWLRPLSEVEARNGVPTSAGTIRSGWWLHPDFRDTPHKLKKVGER